jgi:hypothetical protein
LSGRPSDEARLISPGWLTRAGARLGLGKDGQYLYIDPERRVVIVRQEESTGDFSSVELFEQLAVSAG